MKISKKLLMTSVAAVAVAMGMGTSLAANADGVGASAGIASSYYWRGINVSDGAEFWGDLNYKISGAYAGVWASSEGFGLGPEYDLYAGYAPTFGDFGLDIGAVNYNYTQDAGGADNDPGEFTDAYLGFSYKAFSLKYYHNVALIPGNYFVTASYTLGSFKLTYGMQDYGDAADNAQYQYFDLTYSYNENLSFTLSTIFDADDDVKTIQWPSNGGSIDTNRTKVVVAYSIPLK